MWGGTAVNCFRSSFFLSSVGLIPTKAIRRGKNLEPGSSRGFSFLIALML
jgi:hypothetical protein